MDDAVLETAIEEPIEGVEQSEAEPQETAEGAEEGRTETEAAESDSPYTTKFSREMRAALKQWEAANPEMAKFSKQARDNHARLFALNQLEPRGIDGVREKYSLLDSLALGDVKGVEAITAMQEQLAGVEEVDSLLAAGDPKAFDALGEDFNAGLAKLAPAYLERVQRTDPAAYEAAILPHFVSYLASSEMVKDFNALVDVLEARNDPRFDEKTKMNFAFQQLAKMGEWMNKLATKAGEARPSGPQSGQENQEDPRAEIERERQELHWERHVYPETKKAVEDKFNELLKPLQARLKLTPTQRNAAFADFKAKNYKLGNADKDYMRQINFYRGQRNPDATAIMNLVKANLAKTAKTAFDQVKAERWEAFLTGRPKPAAPAAANGNGAKPQGPVPPNVEIRTVKPPMNEIDHRNTPIAWLPLKQYRLYSGKVIRVVPQG